MNKHPDYIEIDLVRLFKALKRKLWVLVLVALTCGVIGFCYARFMITPTYKASMLMYVNNNSISIGKTLSLSTSDLYASQELVGTYIVIMKSRTTLNEVIKQANLKYSYEQLYSMISASEKDETAVISIDVTSTDPEEAALIANTVAAVLPQKIEGILNGSSARIVDYAVVPKQKSAPSIRRYAVMGMLLGLFISGGLVVLLELMNDSIRNADMLPDPENIPVLGEIPNLKGKAGSEGFSHSHARKNTNRKEEKP